MNERLLSTREAASFLGLCQETLKRWRTAGGGPEYVRVSANRARYEAASLARFVEERKRTSTADPGPTRGK